MNQPKSQEPGTPVSPGYSSRSWLRRVLHRNEVLLITDKKRSPMQNLRHRRRVYNTIQAARIPLLALAGVTWMLWHNWWLAAVLFTVSVPLPWVAVMIANGHGEPRDARERNVYKPALARERDRQAGLEAADTRAIDPGTGTTGKEVDRIRSFEGIIIDADPDDDNRNEQEPRE